MLKENFDIMNIKLSPCPTTQVPKFGSNFEKYENNIVLKYFAADDICKDNLRLNKAQTKFFTKEELFTNKPEKMDVKILLDRALLHLYFQMDRNETHYPNNNLCGLKLVR